MKSCIKSVVLLLLVIGIVSCKLREPSLQNDEFIEYSLTDAKENRKVPLSSLLKNFEIVVFEDSEEAIFSTNRIAISDNYLLIPPGNGQPYKLFDKQGKLLRTIGGIGQGPGEYKLTRDEQIDEKNGKIYVTPFANSSRLLVYNLDGSFDRYIDIGEDLNKPRLAILPNGNLFVIHLPFGGEEKHRIKNLAFELTPQGEIIKEIQPRQEDLISPNYDHELFSYSNSAEFTYMISAFDTLMTYDRDKKELRPLFHLKFPQEDNKPFIIYNEIPHYYLVALYSWNQEARRLILEKRIAVEKKNGKGFAMDLKNDYVGNAQVSPAFMNGYYYEIMEPHQLIEKIQKRLNEKDCTDPKEREKLKKLLDSTDEDGNGILFYGKLK